MIRENFEELLIMDHVNHPKCTNFCKIEYDKYGGMVKKVFIS